jgi:hypothetical protein
MGKATRWRACPSGIRCSPGRDGCRAGEGPGAWRSSTPSSRSTPGLPRPPRRWHSLLEPVLILNTPPAVTWFPPNAWQTTVFATDSTAGKRRLAMPVTRQAAVALEGWREEEAIEGKPGSIAAAWPLVQVLGRRTDPMPPTADGLADRTLIPTAGMSRPARPKRSEGTQYAELDNPHALVRHG